MKVLKLITLVVFPVLLNACAFLKPVTCTGETNLLGYKYAYIAPTYSLSSTSGGVYGNAYGTYGSVSSTSVNPADVISGILMKNGFTLVPELVDDFKAETIIFNYAETGRRYVLGGLLGFTTEITLQILAADTFEVLCTTTAEGYGATEVDDIREAITRAMGAIFPQ